MGLVHYQQSVGWQVVKQRGWRFTGIPPGEIAGVVLDTIAVTELQHHLDVVAGTLLQPLSFHQPVVIPQLLQPNIKLLLDVLDRIQHGLPGGDIVGLRVNGHARHPPEHLSGKRVKIAQVLHFIIEQFDANGFLLGFCREDINDIAPHPIIGAMELDVIAGVLQFGQPPQDIPLIHLVTPVQVQHHFQIGLRITQTVDGRNRRDNDGIRPLQQSLGGRQPHLLNVLIDGGVFFDKGIGRRYVGLRLVVIVVGDEVLHCVIGEELLELAIELRRQGLVMGHDDGWPLDLLNHIGNGESLARTGYPEQGLMGKPGFNAVNQSRNRFGLVTSRLVGRIDAKSPFPRTGCFVGHIWRFNLRTPETTEYLRRILKKFSVLAAS